MVASGRAIARPTRWPHEQPDRARVGDLIEAALEDAFERGVPEVVVAQASILAGGK